MFDQFEPFQHLKKEKFSFQSSTYEIFRAGGIGNSSGQSNMIIRANVIELYGQEKVEITFENMNLSDEISGINIFDEFVTSTDRLILVTIPEETKPTTMAIEVLRMTIGATCKKRNFTNLEPFACNLYLKNAKVCKVGFSFNNPEKLIEFTDSNSQLDFDSRARKACEQSLDTTLNNVTKQQLLVQMYNSVLSNPEQLKNVRDYAAVGTAFFLMLDQGLSNDNSVLRVMGDISYLFYSKAIENDKKNLDLYYRRLLLLSLFGHNVLSFTVASALGLENNINGIPLSLSEYRVETSKMEFADMEIASEDPINLQLYKQIPFLTESKDKFDRIFFLSEETIPQIVTSGLENHRKLLGYLENRIIKLSLLK